MFVYNLSSQASLACYRVSGAIQDDLIPWCDNKIQHLIKQTDLEDKVAYIAFSALAHLVSFGLACYSPIRLKAVAILTYSIMDSFELLNNDTACIYDKILRGLGRGLLFSMVCALLYNIYHLNMVHSLVSLTLLSITTVQEAVESEGLQNRDLKGFMLGFVLGFDYCVCEAAGSASTAPTPQRNSPVGIGSFEDNGSPKKPPSPLSFLLSSDENLPHGSD